MLEDSFDYFDYLADMGFQTPLILLVLIVLEAVLSADNAIALASIAQGLPDGEMQRKALNVGLIAAYVLRIVLILTATWVIQFWQFELLGAMYLLWLVFNYFVNDDEDESEQPKKHLKFASFWQVIPTIAITDLAFSLDSVTTAIAIADETWLIIAGGTIGVISLRFLAELFIRWLEEYTYLEDAGFITVGFVGVRLFLKALFPGLIIPEWVTIAVVAVFFTWGFSKREPIESSEGGDS